MTCEAENAKRMAVSLRPDARSDRRFRAHDRHRRRAEGHRCWKDGRLHAARHSGRCRNRVGSHGRRSFSRWAPCFDRVGCDRAGARPTHFVCSHRRRRNWPTRRKRTKDGDHRHLSHKETVQSKVSTATVDWIPISTGVIVRHSKNAVLISHKLRALAVTTATRSPEIDQALACAKIEPGARATARPRCRPLRLRSEIDAKSLYHVAACAIST
jgi:hypothetical protein